MEKVVGNLTYAAWVSPFGRPFLSVLSSKINPLMRNTAILVTAAMRNALSIWKMILTKNKGLSFDFILGRIPRELNEWFIDASTSYGCGGVAGNRYFKIKNILCASSKFFGQHIKFDDVKIAYRELLSAVIAFLCFAPHSPSSLIRINTDNQNVVSWLNRGRCSKKLGHRLLSVIELMKLKYDLKVSVFFIKSSSNTTADLLSRGKTPHWLKNRGVRCTVKIKNIEKILTNPISFWKTALSL